MTIIKHYPDVLDCIANLSNDEVFTPPVLVNKVLDMLPVEVWSNPDLKWLDPACKTGVFLREIAKRLWFGLEKIIEDEGERKEHIFKNMIYGIAITDITALSSRRSLYYSKNAKSSYSICHFDNPEGNIFYENIQHKFIKGVCVYCGTSEENIKNKKNYELHAYNFIHQDLQTIFKGKDMKFDVIIGNPPYQIKDGEGGGGSSAKPLYHIFINEALKLNPKYLSMIIPARWYAGGKGLDSFRNQMLNDKRISNLHDFVDSTDCFPGVKIEGGICYFLLQKDYSGPCEVVEHKNNETKTNKRHLNEFKDVFIRYNNAGSILNKIILKEDSFNFEVSSRKPFGLSSSFSNYLTNKKDDFYKIYSLNGVGYVDKSLIKNGTEFIKKHKVLLSKAYGYNGNFPHQISGIPFYAEPDSVCTETYLIIGAYDTKEECENLISYYKTKFFRFLLLLRKPTQNISKDCFGFIPNLEMNKQWNDDELFEKYNITKEEQNFINSLIKEMK